MPSLEEKVFNKTLAFFCAVREIGCSFDSPDLFDYFGNSVGDGTADDDDGSGTPHPRSQSCGLCSGSMVLSYSRYGQPHLQCQFLTWGDTSHLVLRNLEEFDLDYLKALLSGDHLRIQYHEENALHKGYGPLTGCTFQASPSQQIAQCC
ncbi:hypothetical protein BDQ17DRAFT_1431599 [Cyathus striatus]|nr:hypothetical protein BDQ17DRAFT_1431599 [Cyathus striatus]